MYGGGVVSQLVGANLLRISSRPELGKVQKKKHYDKRIRQSFSVPRYKMHDAFKKKKIFMIQYQRYETQNIQNNYSLLTKQKKK